MLAVGNWYDAQVSIVMHHTLPFESALRYFVLLVHRALKLKVMQAQQ